VNRRSFLTTLGATAAATSLLRISESQAAAKKRPLTVAEINDRMFVIAGGGGNVTVFNSPEGVLLVDGGSPERSKEVLKLVKQRTGQSRVHTLFNTHWHWDQTGSNLALGQAGTQIIAHENTRLWLSTEVNSKWQNRMYPRLPAKARPTRTFYTKESLAFGDETIDFGYLPQAHADGDIYVFFRKANVLVVGDIMSVGSYPILDYCTNGWLGGMTNATKTLLSVCNPETRIVPGIGPIQARTDLEAESTMLATLQLKLSQLLAQGMSARDMLAAAPTREFDSRWGDPSLFITNAWQGLAFRARELGVAIV